MNPLPTPGALTQALLEQIGNLARFRPAQRPERAILRSGVAFLALQAAADLTAPSHRWRAAW